MVLRHSIDSPASHQVRPAVADVRRIGSSVDHSHGGASGAHARQLAAMAGESIDLAVRSFKGLDQRGLWIGSGRGIGLAHDVYGHMAGHFSALVAAHAVGHNRQHAMARESFRILWQYQLAAVLVRFAARTLVG